MLDMRDVLEAIKRHVASSTAAGIGGAASAEHRPRLGRMVSVHQDRNNVQFFIGTKPDEPVPFVFLADDNN